MAKGGREGDRRPSSSSPRQRAKPPSVAELRQGDIQPSSPPPQRAKAQLQRGTILSVNPAAGYGFLSAQHQLQREESVVAAAASPSPRTSPLGSAASVGEVGDNADQKQLVEDEEIGPKNTFFRLDSNCCSTGLFDLQRGDTLEYISGGQPQKPRAIYTRLVECSLRSLRDMASYLRQLISKCLDDNNTDVVLREITKAPIGLLLLLRHENPDRLLVLLLLKLVVAICSWASRASLYKSKLKQFFQLLAHTPFLMSALEDLLMWSRGAGAGAAGLHTREVNNLRMIMDIEAEWGRPTNTLVHSAQEFVLRMLSEVPNLLPSLLPLVRVIDRLQPLNHEDKSKQEEAELSCDGRRTSFPMQVLDVIGQAKCRNVDDPSVSYDKLSLLPLNSEVLRAVDRLAPSMALPVAKLTGSYSSTEEYIDTYFRLLREDSFASLKKGIRDYRCRKLDCRDMSVWLNVCVMGVHFLRSSPGFVIALTLNDGLVNNPRSQPPNAGSLLCICDGGGTFRSPIWALAARCEKLKKEKASVLFVEILENQDGSEDPAKASPWARVLRASNMVIAESPAYYRAYEPVLRALQLLDPTSMPFQEELVLARSPGKAPDYLKKSTTLDWSCLPHDSSKVYGELIAGANELNRPTLVGFKTTLDDTQSKAINHVLTNRLAIIQGPPGTGKSFLAVKILKLLLSASTLPSKPILIITYKNQALDHFLESCLQFCDEPGSLIRVGGSSKSEKLAPHNLQCLLKTTHNKFTSDWTDNSRKLEELETELRKAMSDVHGCRSFCAKKLMTQLWEDFLHKILLAKDILQTESLVNLSDATQPLQKLTSKVVKEWMPHKRAFNSVQACLSFLKPSICFMDMAGLSGRSDAQLRSSPDEPDQELGPRDLDEENEERNDLEMLRQSINEDNGFRAHSRSRKEMDWTQRDFMSLADSEQDNESLFGSLSLGDFDADEYSWLLQADPWQLSEEHRCMLILVMMQQKLEAAIKNLSDVKEQYDQLCSDNAEINKRARTAILQDAKIIGMTTTGAAMNQDVLGVVAPSIIIVEEAAEILEPQLLAVLSSEVQHLILIGDHKQLRPSVESYELATRHNLSISMLERLAGYNKLPFQTLGFQSRMREEFLQMVQPIYPHLRSNTLLVSGSRNQPSKCMASTMYFWSHSFKETAARSPCNKGEAHMVIALSKWLLSEGHKPTEISVIGAYTGQVSLLRKMMESLKEDSVEEAIEVHTIDRFQGSENQIIIISLVRSNSEGKIGHLSAENRLCVTVSRARSGIYLCGDTATLTERSPHWRSLIDNCFRPQKYLGEAIHLICPRHPKSPPFALHNRDAEHFSSQICSEPCGALLACCHSCTTMCHNGAHPSCRKSVLYIFKQCGHSINKPCSDDEKALKCLKNVWITLEGCGHDKECRCWEQMGRVASALACRFPCGKALVCGHPCTLECSQTCGSSPCMKCAEIQKIKAQKEREIQKELIKAKMLIIDQEIDKLKSEEKLSGPIFKVLLPEDETAAEYRMVQDRTEKFIQPTHTTLPVVTKIEKVSNWKLQLGFLEAQRNLSDMITPPQLLFHGTDNDGVKGITNEGFRLPSASKDNMFGRGCYFATDSSKSAQRLYTKGSNKLLLCEVLLGRSWSVQKAEPALTCAKVRDKGYDSVFSMRDSRHMGGTEFDEYIVYDPRQAIPRYVVHYENLPPSAPELRFLQQIHSSTKFERRTLNASSSSTYGGLTVDEMHFRFAEAQFLRMSTRRGQQVEKVEYTENAELRERYDMKKKEFLAAGKPTEEKLVFHGTTEESIAKIIKEGFKIGGEGGVAIRCGASYGKGVYTASNPEISVAYSSGMMLLSVAVCGREGEDNNLGGSLGVYVIRHSHQLLPRYIVHFRNTA